MHTTSAKFANLKLSLSARLCQLFVLAILSWALAASPAPIALTLFVFTAILIPLFSKLTRPSSEIMLVWNEGSEFRINQEKKTLDRAWLECSVLVTLLIFDDKSRLLVWRDACSDKEYRALLRHLRWQKGNKKEHSTSAL